jgi:hypothetical protein
VVRDGRVVGTWKRTMTKKNTVVDVRPLVPLGASDRARVQAAFAPYAHFTGLPLSLRWADAG